MPVWTAQWLGVKARFNVEQIRDDDAARVAGERFDKELILRLRETFPPTARPHAR
jgi:hypothetical protein